MIKRFADICFNRPLQSAYTYAVPDDCKDPVGKRVIVDFNGRQLTGYAIRSYESQEDSFQYTVKPILKIQDDEPLFGEFQIRLARWIAERYFCSVGEESSSTRSIRFLIRIRPFFISSESQVQERPKFI